MLLLLCGESSEGLMALMALVISGKHKLEQQMCKITHPSILPSQVLIRVFRPVDCKSPRLSIHHNWVWPMVYKNNLCCNFWGARNRKGNSFLFVLFLF